MQEEWRDVVGYEGLYKVSNMGNVKSMDRTEIYLMKGKEVKRSRKGIIMTQTEDEDGYLRITLHKNGIGTNFGIHQIVAIVFIPNPLNLHDINHKDENKKNNFVYINEDGTVDLEKSNIEWCTVKYNNNYNDRQKRIAAKRQKITLQIDPNTNEIIKEWSSIKEAEEELGLSCGHISRCCNGKRKFCGGYKWAFKKGDC